MAASEHLTGGEAQMPLSRSDLIGELLPAVAMVEDLSYSHRDRTVGSNIRGTAFAADERGYFLTAKHVVRGLSPQQMELRTVYSGRNRGAYAMAPCRSIEALYPHPFLDLAVIAVASTFTRRRVTLPFRSEGLSLGNDVVLLGYAMGTELVFADDILGSGSPKSLSPVALAGMVCARIPDDGRPVQLLAYDCTTFAGCSGGPIVSTALDGAIVGIHLRGMSNHIGYGVPIEYGIAFIDAVAQTHERLREAKHLRRRGDIK